MKEQNNKRPTPMNITTLTNLCR